MTTTTQIDTAVYNAAHQNAIIVDRSDIGVIKITGESRLDLIHRMSTQKINGLQPGEGTATILTTDIARIIDRLILYADKEAAYAFTSENNADAVIRYLMRYVFFNDDFHMQDLSSETAVFAIYGPQAANYLQAAGFPETDLPRHHWRQAALPNATAWLHRTDPIAGDGYFISCKQADKTAVYQTLLNANIIPATPEAYDYLRIEHTWPRFGHELTSDYIPLEANLWDDISFSKGCYIGQEIIARMESRNRITKKLVRLQPQAPVTPPVALTADGKPVGTLTSAANGPNGIIALGYVKTAVLDTPNTTLMAGQTPVKISQL